MTIFLTTVWMLLVILSALSAIQARYLGRGMDGSDTKDAYAGYRPFASVVVPFKGVEHDERLSANVRALCEQNYVAMGVGVSGPGRAGGGGGGVSGVSGGGYRLLLIVDSREDPAYGVIESVLGDYPECDAHLLVSGCAGDGEGQKIHNQLFAIEQLERDSDGDHVWVFADSDAVPDREWLGRMVGPLLRGDEIGMTTGYRYLVPVSNDRTGRPRLASMMASLANGSVTSLYARPYFTQAWGGSMALTVATARAGRLQNYLRGALTDDYQFTRMCRDLGKRVYYVRTCLIASPIDFDWKNLINFGHRQYLITRVYRPMVYAVALMLTGVYVWGWLSAVLHAGHYLYHEPMSWRWVPSVLVLGVVHGFNHLRSSYRQRTLRWTLGQAVAEQMRTTWAWDRWGTIVWMSVHHAIILRAMVGNTMRWRGIRYRLRGPQDVVRL